MNSGKEDKVVAQGNKEVAVASTAVQRKAIFAFSSKNTDLDAAAKWSRNLSKGAEDSLRAKKKA
ncbi:hypothetical protein DSO57_1011643 [Entomophthora muscae]|uniref:Uncharacterized protein n=1 Tax=Entomophthora muscae TaxID=34485 RepID=A0ACC2RL37_9FUNG|nr:hypothetical protein DSO57_1011643 [Entomophthora muscae]